MDWPIFFSTFLTIFLAEMGDKTQFAALAAGSKTSSTISVWLAVVLALALAGAFLAFAAGAFLAFATGAFLAFAAGAFLALAGALAGFAALAAGFFAVRAIIFHYQRDWSFRLCRNNNQLQYLLQ